MIYFLKVYRLFKNKKRLELYMRSNRYISCYIEITKTYLLKRDLAIPISNPLSSANPLRRPIQE
jgi:hypothetical protein